MKLIFCRRTQRQLLAPAGQGPCLCLALALIAFLLVRPLGAVELTPELGLKYTSNDNILFDSERAHKLSDSYATLRYGIKLRDSRSNSDLKLTAYGEQLRYRDYDEFDGSNKWYGVDYSCRPWSRLNLALGGSYRDEIQSDRIEDVGLGLRRHRLEALNASADYSISKRLIGRFGASTARDEYSNDPQDDLDSRDFDLGLRYLLTQRVSLLVQTQNQSYDFKDWYLNAGGALRPNQFAQASTRSLSVGVNCAISQRLSFSALAGSSRTVNEVNRSAYNLPDSHERGDIGQLSLSYAGRNLRLSLNASSSFGAQGSDKSTNRRKSLSLDSSYSFNRDLSAGLRVETFAKESTSRLQSVYGSLSDEDTRRLSPWLSYKLSDEVKLDLSYGFTRLRDHVTHDTKERHQADLRLTWQYPFDMFLP